MDRGAGRLQLIGSQRIWHYLAVKPPPKAAHILGFMSSLHLQSQRWLVKSFSCSSTLTLTLLPSSSIFKDHCHYIETNLENSAWGHLISKLNTILTINSSIAYNKISTILGIGMWTFLRTITPPTIHIYYKFI